MAEIGKKIDLDVIVRKRAGNKIPQFLINFLKKLIHQDFINGYLVQGYEGVEFCVNAMKYLDVEIEVEGWENIKDEERKYTFCSNHPLGGVDGLAMGAVFGTKFNGKIKFMVNDFLMNLGGLASLSIPVNKIGSQMRDLPKLTNEMYASENQVVIFPAGLCSRKINGKIQDVEWGKSFINKSIQSHRDIVPVRFYGENSKRFYRFANFCKFLKLKFNFAMLLLPDEMYKAQHKKFKIVIGKPIPYTHFDKSHNAKEWAQVVRAEVYKL